MARGRNCAVHRHTFLVPIEVHHVWPVGYHGPDVAANKVPMCANGHSDTHYLLEALLRGRKVNRSEYGPDARRYAKQGHDAVMAYAKSLADLIA